MLIALIFLLTYSMGTTALLVLGALRNFELMEKFDALEDQIDESLEILDDCYGSISKAAKTEVFSDEPIVRSLMSDIRRARDAVLLIAGKIASLDKENDEKK